MYSKVSNLFYFTHQWKAVLNFEEEEHGEDRKKKLQQLRDRARKLMISLNK